MKKIKEFFKEHKEEIITSAAIAVGIIGAAAFEAVRIHRKCSFDVINITLVMPKNQQQ